MRGDLTIPELKAMLQDRVADLAARLAPRGKRKGAYWLGPSPLRADSKNDTFAIWLTGAARGAFKDFVSGEKGDVVDLVACLACGGGCPPSREARGEALAWARDFLGVSGRDPVAAKASARAAVASREEQERRETERRAEKQRRAFERWGAGIAMRDTAGEAYLRARGIEARGIPGLENCLRFARRLEHPHEPHVGPAMMARFTRTDGAFSAVHCTFLREDGSGKADVSKAKIIFGGFAGAAIRVSKGESGLGIGELPEGARGMLVVVEGIEDGLTVAQARPEWRVWAAGSLDNIGNQPALACFSSFLVIQDNDVKPAATKALARGLAKLRAHGIPVEAFGAIGGAKDINEALRREWA